MSNVKQVKVTWRDCCLTKAEGGLGFRDLCDWSRAAFIRHLWRIIQPGGYSLWIAWFRCYIQKNKPFYVYVRFLMLDMMLPALFDIILAEILSSTLGLMFLLFNNNLTGPLFLLQNLLNLLKWEDSIIIECGPCLVQTTPG